MDATTPYSVPVPGISSVWAELALPGLGEVRFSVPVQDEAEPTCIVGPNGSGKTSLVTCLSYLAMGGIGLAFDSPVRKMAVFFDDECERRLEVLAAGESLGLPEGAHDDPSRRSDRQSAPPIAYLRYTDAGRAERGVAAYEWGDRTMSRSELGKHPATAAEDVRWRLAFGAHAPVSASAAWGSLGLPLGALSVALLGTLRLGLPSARYADAILANEERGTLPACRRHLQAELSATDTTVEAAAVATPASEAQDFADRPHAENHFAELLKVTDRFFDAQAAVDFFASDDPVCTLSAGQQHILAMLYGVLLASEERSLVLIDEPELSLHAAWQHPILHELSNAAALRGSRIIAATHSAAVLNDWWDNAVAPEAAAGPLQILTFGDG